jgi:D-alanine-D-alanine ligase
MGVMAKDLGKVAVLLGGSSAEREISLISGKAVLAALQERGVDAFAFDPAATPIWRLAELGVTRVFNILHGGAGEDGTVQGALDLLGIPYTGSGVLGSALAMDKIRTKWVWQAAGVPTPRSRHVHSADEAERVIDALGLPLIVKPVREGSSIGLTKLTRAEDFAAAYAAAATLPDGRSADVMAEEFLAGTELTCAILGRTPLPLVRIEAPAAGYDYQNKYFTDAVKYHCPAGLPADVEARIGASVLAAFDALGCRGWGRADLILRADGSYGLLEMNTNPGMTGHSLVPMAARAAGIGFADLVLAILAEARCGQA